MSEEITKQNEEQVNTPQDSVSEEKKTFTLEEVQNLLSAKNHEKEQRKTAEAEVRELKEQLAKLKGEDSVSKYKEDEYNQLKQQLENLKKEKQDLETLNQTNALKDELRKIAGINSAAIDDVTDKALKRGFKKSELGFYLDKDGKTIEDFANDLKTSHSYYFGISSNKNIIPEALQKQIDNAKKTGNTLGMLQEAWKGIDFKNLK